MYKEIKEEKLLESIDSIYGSKKCKEVLNNYLTFLKIKKRRELKKINYNIFINNKSEHNDYEKVVDVIEKLLVKNEIITGGYRYLKRDDIKKVKGSFERFKKIKEDLIVIDSKKLGIYSFCLAEDVRELLEEFTKKVFIIIGNNMLEGSFNSEIGNLVAWSMTIEKMTTDEKEDYIKKYFNNQRIRISSRSSFVTSFAKEPFWKIKDEALNISLACKQKNIKTIDDNIIKKDLKKQYYSITQVKQKKKLKSLEDLNSMVGMKEVKTQIEKIMNFIRINKDRKYMPALHMCFTGNPGTGKTTVARIIGKVFAENEILSDKEKFLEIHGRDLVGQYVGWTAYETKRKIEEALGGVLFIDEAYSLNSDRKGGFEDEAIATLIKEMEDKRDKICVILAGYKNEMKELIDRNPGFESRIQFYINFPDYTEDELYEIFKKIAKSENYKMTNNLKQLLITFFKEEKKKTNFANGRCVRNLFERIKFEQSNRVAKNKDDDIDLIKKEDIKNAINIIKEHNKEEKVKRPIGFTIN